MEHNIIEDIRILLRLEREIKKKKRVIDYNAIKHITNLFRLKKENNAIKERLITYFKNLFEHEEKEDYYKQIR